MNAPLFNVLAAVLLLTGLPTSSAHAADEPIVLEPSSEWVLDYEDDACSLRRAFGGASDIEPVYLEMRQYAPGDSLETWVATDRFSPRRNGRDQQFEGGWLPDPDDARERVMTVEMPTGLEGFVHISSLRSAAQVERDEHENGKLDEWPDSDRDAREGAITGYLVGNVFSEDFILQTGEMHGPMNAMRTCIDELLGHWGIDAEANRTLNREAEPKNLLAIARDLQEHYPSEMLLRGYQAIVNLRAIVEIDGTASDCAIRTAVGSDEFKAESCRIVLDKARFDPALDRNGDPVQSYWVTTITYQIGR